MSRVLCPYCHVAFSSAVGSYLPNHKSPGGDCPGANKRVVAMDRGTGAARVEMQQKVLRFKTVDEAWAAYNKAVAVGKYASYPFVPYEGGFAIIVDMDVTKMDAVSMANDKSGQSVNKGDLVKVPDEAQPKRVIETWDQYNEVRVEGGDWYDAKQVQKMDAVSMASWSGGGRTTRDARGQTVREGDKVTENFPGASEIITITRIFDDGDCEGETSHGDTVELGPQYMLKK